MQNYFRVLFLKNTVDDMFSNWDKIQICHARVAAARRTINGMKAQRPAMTE